MISDNRVKTLRDDAGRVSIPSCVTFDNGSVFVGVKAASLAALDPKNAVSRIGQIIGLEFDDPKVTDFACNSANGLIRSGHSNSIGIVIPGDTMRVKSPEEVAMEIFKKLKTTAECYLCCNIGDAVISVPYKYGSPQQDAVRKAATLAGLNVLQLVEEPIATAIAYGLQGRKSTGKHILCYKFDRRFQEICIIDKTNDDKLYIKKRHRIEDELNSFTNLLAEYVIEKYQDEQQCTMSEIKNIYIKNAIENFLLTAKIRNEGSINLSFPSLMPNTMTGFTIEISSNMLIAKCLATLSQNVTTLLEELELSKDNIHEIVLTGEFSHLQLVHHTMSNMFPHAQLNHSINPKIVGSHGAAILAASKCSINTPQCMYSFVRNKISNFWK